MLDYDQKINDMKRGPFFRIYLSENIAYGGFNFNNFLVCNRIPSFFSYASEVNKTNIYWNTNNSEEFHYKSPSAYSISTLSYSSSAEMRHLIHLDSYFKSISNHWKQRR